MITGTKLTFVRHLLDGDVYITEFVPAGKIEYYPNAPAFGLFINLENNKLKLCLRRVVDNETIDYEYLNTRDSDPVEFSNNSCIIHAIRDADSIKQNLEARCSILRGELPYNTSIGITLNMNQQATRLAILNTINSTPGVNNTTVQRSYIKDRKYTMDLEISTNLGTILTTV